MLTSQQKALVKATIPTLKASGQSLTDYFYQRMLNHVPQLKETFNMGHQRDGRQAKALANAVLAYAEHIDDPRPLLPVIELICHKHVSLNIQAPDYAIVGEHLLHSMSEVLGISMEDELISAWGSAYQDLAEIFIATERKIYEKHKQTLGSWIGWRQFTLDRKVIETPEVTSFYLTPTDHLPLPHYLPGQFITLRTEIATLGYKQPRQYSLSTAPNGQFFRISVKEATGGVGEREAGYVSTTLHHQLNVGDRVELSAPTGNFTIADPNKHNVLISAGIGITPMVAMLEGLLENNLQQKLPSTSPTVTFIHAARDAEHCALGEEVRALAEQHPAVQTFVTVEHARHDCPLGHAVGRLILRELPPSLLPIEADFYICGPVPFVEVINNNLQELGIPVDQIHYEVFSTGGTAS